MLKYLLVRGQVGHGNMGERFNDHWKCPFFMSHEIEIILPKVSKWWARESVRLGWICDCQVLESRTVREKAERRLNLCDSFRALSHQSSPKFRPSSRSQAAFSNWWGIKKWHFIINFRANWLLKRVLAHKLLPLLWRKELGIKLWHNV